MQDFQSQEVTTPKDVSHLQTVGSDVYESPLRIQQQPMPLISKSLEESPEDLNSPLLRKRKEDGDSSALSPLKMLVGQVQEVTTLATTQARTLSQELTTILRDSQETTTDVIEVVRSEDGKKFRLAAITASSLIGYLVGQKRGFVTKLAYSVTGAIAMTTICYPKETKIYNRQGLATVKRWMIVALSVIPRGPQRPLGGSDLKISDVTESNNDEETEIENSDDEEQYKTSLDADNIFANLKQRLQDLDHNLEEIEATLRRPNSPTVAYESKKENNKNSVHLGASDSAATNSLEQPTHHLVTDHFDKLSTENDKKDLPPNSVPYSPALPVPPKINVEQHKLYHHQKEDTLTDKTVEDTTTTKCSGSKVCLKSKASDGLSSGDDDNDEDDREELIDDFSDFPENTFVIPTGGLDEKLVARRGHLKKTDEKKNNEAPLNKKLNTYYRNIPEEERTSREKGYDDAYSNRGK